MYYYLPENDHSGNSICSPGQEAVCSAESFSDIPKYVLSRLNLIAEKSCCNANETESCQSFQYGTMCEHSTGNLGGERLTSFVEDSHVKTYPLLVREQELMENEADCGGKCAESLAKYDPATHSLRTRQLSLFEGEGELLATLPEWGILQHGECWGRSIVEHLTEENGFGSLPTSVKADGSQGAIISDKDNFYITATGLPRKVNGKGTDGSVGLSRLAGLLPTPNCGDAKNPGGNQNQNDLSKLAKASGKRLSPLFSEWMMGWPTGWTDIMPLETDKFQQWRQQHSEFYQRD